MSLLTDAKAFMDKLLHRRDERVRARCGSPLTKKNGHRRRSLRDLGGVRTVSVQRHICLECRESYSEELPEIAPHEWYTRRVKRTFVDKERVRQMGSFMSRDGCDNVKAV